MDLGEEGKLSLRTDPCITTGSAEKPGEMGASVWAGCVV